nr:MULTISPECIES: TRAM domain-containing protein [Archaeoglobus]
MLKLSEFGREFGRAPPVEVGDIREVRIEAVGSEGDGIAKVDGFVVFVPGVKVDDVVTIRITKVLRKYGFAEVVE